MFSIPKHSFCSFSSIAVLWLSMPLPSLQSNATTYPVSLQFNLWHVRCKKFPKHSTKISQFKKIPQKVKPVNIITLLRVIPTLAFQDIYFDIYFDNLPNILSDIYSDILSGILHFIWYMFWQSFWHIFWHSIWPLRSSGAHWARKVPGWGPAVPTGSEDPWLRSSRAHCARKLAKSEELAMRKWTWKWRQRWWRRRRRTRRRRTRRSRNSCDKI